MANLRCRDAQLWRDPARAGRRHPLFGLETVSAREQFSAMPRRPRSRIVARLVLLIGVAAAGFQVSGTSLAQKCPLTDPLILSDLHGGFVGQTGTIWTIAPDCSFTVARQVGPNAADPHKQGRLTPDQQTRLAALLARIELKSLPAQLGDVPQPNARQITVSCGHARSVLTLPPASGGALNPALTPADRHAAWVLELGDILKDMIGI